MASATGFRRYVAAALGALSLVAAMPASADESQSPINMFDGQWHFSVTPYAWIPTIYTSATYRPVGLFDGVTANMHSTIGDYLGDLSFAFFITGEARKGDWSMFTDYIYLKMKGQDSGVRPNPVLRAVDPGSIPYDAAMDLSANVWTLAVGYTGWRSNTGNLDVFAGTRLFNLNTSLNFSVLGVARSLDASTTMNKWDGIVGIRGRVNLGDDGKWFMPYYLDVGAGSANTTWQALIGAGYRYGWGDVTLVVRNLSYDFTGKGDGGVDARFTGVALGATFPF